jgi:hypothetical protein
LSVPYSGRVFFVSCGWLRGARGSKGASVPKPTPASRRIAAIVGDSGSVSKNVLVSNEFPTGRSV